MGTTNQTSTKTIIAQLDAHAMRQYENGWDYWVEALDHADKVALVGRCRTYEAARRKIQKALPGGTR